MTEGRLVSPRFPYIPIRVRIGSDTIETEALLDTGFDGHVIIPANLVPNLASPDGDLSWTLADGSDVSAPYVVGSLHIGSFPAIPVLITLLGDDPLVGREIATHFIITLDHGQRVIVEP